MLRCARTKERAATPRELEVARLIAGGSSAAEAAAWLRISEKTVQSHLYNLYRKWSVHTRIGLALELRKQDAKHERLQGLIKECLS